jgi:hypothetical protein
MFKARYAPIANFAAQQQPSLPEPRRLRHRADVRRSGLRRGGNLLRALRYKAIPLGEAF